MTEPASGVSTLHTSVPRPATLAPDWSGTRHLVIVERPEPVPPELSALVPTPACEVLATDSFEACEAVLRQRLEQAHVGLRLYLVGAEAFTCPLESIAFGAGMLPSEIRSKILAGEVRVWCTHCKAITAARGANLVECDGCGRQLTLYHHFSKRHGAYMGFQADAELPGELPELKGGLPWT